MQRQTLELSVLTASMDSWFFLSCPRLFTFLRLRSGGGEEPGRAKGLRLILDPFTDVECGENQAC